jgi:hypothetical protein
MTTQELIAAVYRDVFSRTAAEDEFYPDRLADPEFAKLSDADVDRYFAPSYTQQTNETGYNLDEFKQHVLEVKGRPPASFGVEVLLQSPEHDAKQTVVIRVVVTDAASGKVLGLVLSCWNVVRSAGDQLRIVRNRELTFGPSDPPAAEDSFATLLDPATWPADVRVANS